MTEIRRTNVPGLLGALPRFELTPETARRLTGKLRMAPDALHLSTDGEGEVALKPAATEESKKETKENKENSEIIEAVPTPKEAIDPVKKANTVVNALEDLTKTSTASGKALANATKVVSAPISGRHIGLRDAIIEGNESAAVAAVSEGTPLAHGIGIYNNLLRGGMLKEWKKAREINADPNADWSDRAMADLSATASTADTYNAVKGLSKTTTDYVKANWMEANRQLSNWGDVASFSNQAVKDSAQGLKQIATEFPEKIVEGLKGNRGGVADIAVKVSGKAGKEAVEQGGKLAFKTSRFAAGLNIACAAYDVLHAGKVLSSEKGALQKGLALTTAIGSVIAATNIPGISQAGAALSFATSVAEAAVDKKEGKNEEETKSAISWSTV